jgi:acyl-CoA thioesterase
MAKFFCVESPFVDLCSLEEVERMPDGVRSRVVLKPELTNSWGSAHGGLIATLLDASMTVAARYAVDPDGQQVVATVDLSVTYIGPGKAQIDCVARVTGRSGPMVYVEAKAFGADGGLVARAVATSRVIGSKK